MNPQDNSNIDWARWSWNPYTGCTHREDICSTWKDCWARKNSKRQRDFTFMPTFYPERLDQPLRVKKPARIFAISKGDLFCENCPEHFDAWRNQIIDKIALARWHKFIMLTKNTANLRAYVTRMSEGAAGIKVFPPNLWIGPSIAGLEKNIMKKLLEVPNLQYGGERLISFEPLSADIPLHLDIPAHFKQFFIGALNLGQNRTVQPDPEYVANIITHAKRTGAAIMMKKNLKPNYDRWPTLKQIHPDLKMPGEK